MPTTQLQRSRDHAYQAQEGLCHYCGAPMWLHGPEELTEPFPNLTPQNVARLQCTAEHLHPRSEGGKDGRDNIVAACLHCNASRHRLYAVAPDPETYRLIVRLKMRAGVWQPPSVIELARLCGSAGPVESRHPERLADYSSPHRPPPIDVVVPEAKAPQSNVLSNGEPPWAWLSS